MTHLPLIVLGLLCAGWYDFLTSTPVSCKLRGGEASFRRTDLYFFAVAFEPGGEACESESKLNVRFLPSFEALRNEAGVILGDVSSSESSTSTSESEVGVLGRLEGARPFLPFIAALACREVVFKRVGLFTAFNAPGFNTFRCRLKVVVLDDLSEPLTVRLVTVGRIRLEMVNAVDRFTARSSRDAFCREYSAASISACSRAALAAASSEALVFAVALLPMCVFRFLGDTVLFSDLARPAPRKS